VLALLGRVVSGEGEGGSGRVKERDVLRGLGREAAFLELEAMRLLFRMLISPAL